jgi:hypothetical protein
VKVFIGRAFLFDPVISYRKWREPTTAAQHKEGSKEKKSRVVSHYSSYATASKRQKSNAGMPPSQQLLLQVALIERVPEFI